MRLGNVVGMVVSTVKDEGLRGIKLLLVEDADEFGRGKGSYYVAADAVGAGRGETVLTAAGSSARQTKLTRDRPVDAVVMAIVETVERDGEVTYRKGEVVAA
ncbi:MAG: ethanolamine utilization protein EutN [candidate division Zixibacteria bacterium]|nr:ethanolamine utilization protein EutN [candidate division Zixibacteria bacterium]